MEIADVKLVMNLLERNVRRNVKSTNTDTKVNAIARNIMNVLVIDAVNVATVTHKEVITSNVNVTRDTNQWERNVSSSALNTKSEETTFATAFLDVTVLLENVENHVNEMKSETQNIDVFAKRTTKSFMVVAEKFVERTKSETRRDTVSAVMKMNSTMENVSRDVERTKSERREFAYVVMVTKKFINTNIALRFAKIMKYVRERNVSARKDTNYSTNVASRTVATTRLEIRMENATVSRLTNVLEIFA